MTPPPVDLITIKASALKQGALQFFIPQDLNSPAVTRGYAGERRLSAVVFSNHRDKLNQSQLFCFDFSTLFHTLDQLLNT